MSEKMYTKASIVIKVDILSRMFWTQVAKRHAICQDATLNSRLSDSPGDGADKFSSFAGRFICGIFPPRSLSLSREERAVPSAGKRPSYSSSLANTIPPPSQTALLLLRPAGRISKRKRPDKAANFSRTAYTIRILDQPQRCQSTKTL